MHLPNVGPSATLAREWRIPRRVQQETKWSERYGVENMLIAAAARTGRSRLHCFHRGKGSGIAANAYPMTAMAVAFSRSSRGTILSSVSAAV